MSEILQILSRHGPAVLFAAVLVEQLGIPLPATPWLLASGALAATGHLNWVVATVTGGLGSLIADGIWFYLGRRGGYRILGLLCRVSLSPDSCVHKTHDVFTRYGMRGILMAKFIPGLSTLAPPLAGILGMHALRFLAVDGLASLLYVGGLMGLGVLFSHQLEKIMAAVGNLGGSALAVLIGIVALYLGYKYLQRRRMLSELRMARITVDELQEKLKAGELPLILDVRSPAEIQLDPMLISGARHIALADVEARHQEIPRDREVVLYCSCPNEASAAYAALLLRKKGITRVRPLLGGIDAWRERNDPRDLQPAEAPMRATAKPQFQSAN